MPRKGKGKPAASIGPSPDDWSSQHEAPPPLNFITSGLAEHAQIESSILKRPREPSPRSPSPPLDVTAGIPVVSQPMALDFPEPLPTQGNDNKDDDEVPLTVEFIEETVINIIEAGGFAQLAKSVFRDIGNPLGISRPLSDHE
jgi:hypothetical protein